MTFVSNVVILIFILFSGCASLTGKILKDPEVQFKGLDVTDISLKNVTVNLKVNVKNPNPVPLKLDNITYALKIAGQNVTQGTFDQGVNIPSLEEGLVVVPLKFEYNAVGAILEGLIKKTITRDYEINGTAKIGFFSIPFSQKGKIELEDK